MYDEELVWELTEHLTEKYGADSYSTWTVNYALQPSIRVLMPNHLVLTLYWNEIITFYNAYGLDKTLVKIDDVIDETQRKLFGDNWS